MRRALVCSFVMLFAFHSSTTRADSPINYTRDIRPILSARCYKCHGPDEGKRKAKLRLDVREIAIKKAIKPGDAAGSELIARITSKEPEEVMPPPASKMLPLTAPEIDLVRRWIDQGAKFDTHWAYVKPSRPALPPHPNPPPQKRREKAAPSPLVGKGCGRGEPRNAIDYFAAAKRQAAGWRPVPDADRVTLMWGPTVDL